MEHIVAALVAFAIFYFSGPWIFEKGVERFDDWVDLYSFMTSDDPPPKLETRTILGSSDPVTIRGTLDGVELQCINPNCEIYHECRTLDELPATCLCGARLPLFTEISIR